MARSPNYPAHGLSEAAAFIRQVYDREKRTQVAGEDIAKALGYSGLSGNARSKIASMKKYELLDGDESKGMRVSELAVHLLYPSNEKEELDARRKAALSPDLFRLLYDEKREGSDESIKNFLVSRMEFTPSGAEQAVLAFRDTISFAQLPESAYNASSTPDGVEAQSMQSETRSASPVTSPEAPSWGVSNSALTNSWTWTLSMPRSVKAELRIAGEPTRSDIARLKKQIEFLEESFDEESN